jgi:regulator of replication initiation timing
MFIGHLQTIQRHNMAGSSGVTQKELAEAIKELREEFKVVYKAIGGLREEIEKKLGQHDNMIMDRAKAIGDLGVQVKKLEDYIKKVDKENWL